VRICLVTTFFPNRAMPRRAVFVRNLAVALQARVALTVVAPVPFAPPLPGVSRWKLLRSIELRAADGPLAVYHPRFVAVPKLEALNGVSYGLGVLRLLRSLVRERSIQLLHAHCAYPDAVGVAIAAAALRLPFVMTAHGSDINVYADKPAVRPQLRWALRRAAAVIAVSRAIEEKIRVLEPSLGSRLVHIPCAAADPAVFEVRDQAQARRRLGLEPAARIVVFAGELVPIKGVATLVQAWGLLAQSGQLDVIDRLIVIGEGPLKQTLQSVAQSARIAHLVSFAGEMSQEELSTWLSAASVFCLPSRNEGTPNVVIEALACGRPVVASAVGGIPDLIRPSMNGVLVNPGDAGTLAQALSEALGRTWNPEQIARTVSGYTWEVLAQRNAELFSRVICDGAQETSCP
jgi:teichuronic acid biosynthesis glycosyltransferase TuaC